MAMSRMTTANSPHPNLKNEYNSMKLAQQRGVHGVSGDLLSLGPLANLASRSTPAQTPPAPLRGQASFLNTGPSEGALARRRTRAPKGSGGRQSPGLVNQFVVV